MLEKAVFGRKGSRLEQGGTRVFHWNTEFSDLDGVMALNNLNILSAEVYTRRDGTALDIFRVSKPLDRIHPEKTWMGINRDLEITFQSKSSVDQIADVFYVRDLDGQKVGGEDQLWEIKEALSDRLIYRNGLL